MFFQIVSVCTVFNFAVNFKLNIRIRRLLLMIKQDAESLH